MLIENTSIFSEDISRQELKNLNFFWAGFIVYTVCFALTYTPHATNVFHAIQLVAAVFIIIPACFLVRLKIENKFLKIIYFIYVAWLLITVIRGFQIDSTFIKDMLYDARYGLFPYFVPFILLFPKSRLFYKKLFDAIFILGITFLIIDVLFIGQLLSVGDEKVSIIEIFAPSLALHCGFVLLTINYHSTKRAIFSLIVIIACLLFAIIGARRGLIFMCSTMILSSFLLYTYYSNRKLTIIYLSIFMATAAALYVSKIYKVSNKNIFSYVLERGDEDTRTTVELYFYDDLKTKDWIVGRGISGQYFCPDIEENQATNYRNVIETDYLQIILNGGLISLGLLLFILIPAIFLGLFYSNNILSKAAAIWILLWIFYLYPARVSTFTLHYLLVWISVGICYSKAIRNMSETDIKRLFLNEPS